MKTIQNIRNKTFALLIAVVMLLGLTAAVGCSKPSTDEGDEADVTFFSVMDEDTTKLYEELSPEWQRALEEQWDQIRVQVLPEHWAEFVAESIKAQHENEFGGGEIKIDDVMDEETLALFGELSSAGHEVATLSFEHIKAVFPRGEWERLVQKYVSYLHESEAGGWMEKGTRAQASVDPVGAPDMADYMDEATAKQFEEMNDEWQEMARSGWVDITTKFAPDAPEDWKDSFGDIISQMYAQAKIQGGIRGVPVAGVRDLIDPGKGASPDGTTPFVLSILSPGYTEAYELIPEGSLMREYLDVKLGRFSERGWETIKAQPDEPYPVPAPKLDAGDEFELRKMLTNAGDAGWLIERLRSLDAGAAREYEATKDVTERLAVFRRLVEVDGKGQGVEEIHAEYGARSHGWDDDEIAAHIELLRVRAAEKEALSRMTPRQRYINHAESTLCGDLLSHVVGQDFRTANSGPGQCNIAKVITLTKEALEAGKTASSEEQLREAVEFARQTPGQ